jgi:hypothetical protein
MKTILPITFLFIFFATSCVTTQYTVDAPATVDVPENVLFLGQSGTQDDLYQTVIDLRNNEIVILQYGSGYLDRVFRTGMKANPKDYANNNVLSTDVPFKNIDEDEAPARPINLDD